ncbi:MADS-box transcription factor 8-like [Miscanthus floridulus]|uniref:MADS-box transcription factor 8-like n=1 Tax=Miscanthus floridulus TaxID=154761 RepID=UPI00345868D1
MQTIDFGFIGNYRNLLGEDLGSLGIKELEKQLDSSLRHIRSTWTQHMLDQLTDLQRREQMLCEANKCLRRKVKNGVYTSMNNSTLQVGRSV